MHGRPREAKHKLRDPKAAEGYKKKVDAIRHGTALVLECRRLRRYDAAALAAAAKLLKVVPEIYTVWNYRREALAPAFEAGGEAAQKASDDELALTQACLLENPKSYATWHQRKWVVLKGHADLGAELRLVGSALEQDGRNFHAWAYRQFIVKLTAPKVTTEDELSYAAGRIAADFSNYSAWHYRTILLHKLHTEEVATVSFEDLVAGRAPPPPPAAAGAAPGVRGAFSGTAAQRRPVPAHVLDTEYDLVHQAFATDASDQSPWMYYRWLLGNSLAALEAARQLPEGARRGAREEEEALVLGEVLQREVARFEGDHLAAEPDARWPLLMVARIKEAQARLGLAPQGDTAEGLLAQAKAMYLRLAELDPMRAGYYRDAAEGRAFVVVQALGTFYCSHLSAAAGWCIFSGLCPAEGAASRRRAARPRGARCRAAVAPIPYSGPARFAHPPHTLACTRTHTAPVRAIEDCIGIGSSAGKAPVIPKRCQDRAALLEACLESKQALAEAKTSRCSGPQPIPPPTAAGGGGGAADPAAGADGAGAPKRRGRPPKPRPAADGAAADGA
ncbi:MAG: hypothetical protein J3K34DRAFT_519200 [Monoraphidium minutum]|nr:MAG: hypothetical protein J3K34DRAFT_519200 [Monoraphidium minutum]